MDNIKKNQISFYEHFKSTTDSSITINILNARLKELDLNYYKLHQLTGIPQSSLSRYFNKKTEIPLSVFFKICYALKLILYLPRYEDFFEVENEKMQLDKLTEIKVKRGLNIEEKKY